MRKTMGSLVAAGWLVLTGLSAHALEVGEVAPGFETESTHGLIRLDELKLKGPVVLAFYYADFTPV